MPKVKKSREELKQQVLAVFNEGDKLYTAEVARRAGLKWPQTDRLLQQLVAEGRLFGNKTAYMLQEPEKLSMIGKLKNALGF